MPLHHDPVVPLVLGHRAPRSSCLDSRGWMSQLDSGGCAHRIRMVDGGRIPFGRHGCASQSDAMGVRHPNGEPFGAGGCDVQGARSSPPRTEHLRSSVLV
jgi:hypothetical protein